MSTSSRSEAFVADRLEVLKLSAFLETDILARKEMVDKMAALGSLALPYLSDLIRSLRKDEKVPYELLQYCHQRIEQLNNKDCE